MRTTYGCLIFLTLADQSNQLGKYCKKIYTYINTVRKTGGVLFGIFTVKAIAGQWMEMTR